jgi:hypothetical protein
MSVIAPQPTPAPPAVGWFKVYSAGMALIYLATLALSSIFFLLSPEDLEMSRFEAMMLGTLLGGLGFVLLVVYLAVFFLPRRPWVWTYDLVLIAIGFTSCLTLPFSLPLLIFWLKPEVKQHFGRA